MGRIRVADYIARKLADGGADCVFMITGGGAMHLNDAFGGETRLRKVFNHHEQASAMGAEGYSRVTGRMGIVNVTTGPGGLNALNGVFGAWTDSIPMLVISGQVKRETCLQSHPELASLRQLGDQEVSIVPIAKPITKYAAYVSDPESIRYHLEKACSLAVSGRPGPCWLDIPVDVQGALVEEDGLTGWTGDGSETPKLDGRQCEEVVRRIKAARRPVIFMGNGLRQAKAVDKALAFASRLGVPVVTSWSGVDLIPSDHPLFCGRPGTVGDRPGNFAVQNADFLLVLGSRLNVRQVSYNWENFARNAFRVVVDIDPAEREKPLSRPDLGIRCDVNDFLDEMPAGKIAPSPVWGEWLQWARERRAAYPVVTERHRTARGRPNPYDFFDRLFRRIPDDAIVVCGNGAACVIGIQTAIIKSGTRMFVNSGDASMGYDLPAAIGAAVAAGGRTVICIAGDGSLMMNLQELQTLSTLKLDLKVFVIENGGYLSIRSTQRSFFNGRLVGEGPSSGVEFPDYPAAAAAFGIGSSRISDVRDMEGGLERSLAGRGPHLCAVSVDPEQLFEPKLSSRVLPDGRMQSSSLEDMYPFLSPEEMERNRIGE